MTEGSGRSTLLSALVIGAVVIVVALAGLAAGGLPPGELSERLWGSGDADAQLDLDLAVPVESDALDAYGVELWIGPEQDGGKVCAVVRTNWPGAGTGSEGVADSEPRCVEQMLPWSAEDFDIRTNSQYFGWLDETPIGSLDDGFGAVGLTGAVHPEVTAVTAFFGDGAQYSFSPRRPDGWFAVVLPEQVADIDRSDGRLVNGLISLELFANDGSRLTTIDTTAGALAGGS